MALYRGSGSTGTGTKVYPLYRRTPGFCDGFTGLFCDDGTDALQWGTGPTGGTMTSDGTQLTANGVGSPENYAGYFEIETTIGVDYRVDIELTSTITGYFYVETRDTSWNAGLNVEPMNNDLNSTPGIYYGTFRATETTTRILFGRTDGSTFTFKNVKAYAI